MAFEFDKMSINGIVINAKDLDGRELIEEVRQEAATAASSAADAALAAQNALNAAGSYQGQIDGIESTVTGVYSDLRPLFKYKAYSATFENLGANLQANLTFNVTAPDGYRIFGVREYTTGALGVIIRNVDLINGRAAVQNLGTAQASGTCTISFIFIRIGTIQEVA